MAISDNINDRDKKAYKENALDGGLDRRVTDVSTQAKLDDVISALGSTSSVSIIYNEVTSVASGVTTAIVTYTAGAAAKIKGASAGGTNIAYYELVLNGSVIDKKWTNFGGELGVNFDFIAGLSLVATDVLLIRVRHVRGSSGDFAGKIVVGI